MIDHVALPARADRITESVAVPRPRIHHLPRRTTAEMAQNRMAPSVAKMAQNRMAPSVAAPSVASLVGDRTLESHTPPQHPGRKLSLQLIRRVTFNPEQPTISVTLNPDAAA